MLDFLESSGIAYSFFLASQLLYNGQYSSLERHSKRREDGFSRRATIRQVRHIPPSINSKIRATKVAPICSPPF
jgi:hypothetical protein